MTEKTLKYALATILVHGVFIARDIMLAEKIGTSLSLDILLVAMACPYIISAALSGAFNGVLVPWSRMHAEFQNQNAIKSFFFICKKYQLAIPVCLGLVWASGLIFMPPSPATNSSFMNPNRYLILVCISFYFILTAFQSYFRAVLLSRDRIAIVVGSPVISSAASLLALWLCGAKLGVSSYIFGLLTGALLELITLICFSRGGTRYNKVITIAEIAGLTKNFMDLFISALLMGTTVLIDQLMTAKMFGSGVASLNYANKIPAGFSGVMGGLIATVIFPSLADDFKAAGARGLIVRTKRMLIITFVIATAVCCLIYAFSEDIIALLFLRGAFGADDLVTVSRLQSMFILQLPFYLCGGILVAALKVLRKNRWILVIGTCNVFFDILWNYVLGHSMGLPGIALSTTLVYAGSFSMLLFSLLMYSRRCQS